VASGEPVERIATGDGVRLVHVEDGFRIGDLRNFGASRALGSLIAHWDDDDYSAPGRLADQVERLITSGKAVTGYSSMRFTDGCRWWLYRGHHRFSLGTSLMYRKDWWEKNPFVSKHIGEDGEFVKAADRDGQLQTSTTIDMMAASIHNGNTSPRHIGAVQWEPLPDFAGEIDWCV